MVIRVLWENLQRTTNILEAKYDIAVTPKRVEVNINNYKEADTFNCDLDYKNFPFDPRSIRAIGVSIYMQDMKRLVDDTGKPTRIVPSPDNLVFVGFADEETIKMDDNAGLVSFSGRDYTSLLLDRAFVDRNGVAPTIDLSVPLDKAIQRLLSELPETQAIEVKNRTGETLPTIAKYAPDYSPLAASKNVDKKDKYWEVIQDLVSRAALVAYIELDKLVITSPRVLYGATKAKQLIYGKNLKSLEFKRKLGRVKGYNIQVQSLNYQKKEVLTAKIPEQASQEFIAATGIPREAVKIPKPSSNGQITQEPAPYLAFNVPNIADQNQLIKIGEKIFEEVSRQEIEGQAVTKDMMLSEITANEAGHAQVGPKSDAVRSTTGFDIFKIRNATPIAIFVDWEDLQAISQLRDSAQRRRYLEEHAFAPKVAAALADVIGKQPNVFYTRSVKFSMDSDGFSCEIDFINYVRAPKK